MKSGYKRKIRVVFVASGSVRRAHAAAEFALASGWMEARAHCLPPMMAAFAGLAQEPAWIWADLVVALDRYAHQALPPLPSAVQVKCYEFPEPVDEAAWPALRHALRGRVEGMVAGLAMMERAAQE